MQPRPLRHRRLQQQENRRLIRGNRFIDMAAAASKAFFKDYFSAQAEEYSRFRPRYPREMFEYLGTTAPGRKLAWDCAKGNGQAAVELAEVFDRVIATDASEKQIVNAQRHECVEYRVEPAEESSVQSDSIDVIIVAQALHWFDRDRFYAEARRVLTPRGVLAASAYNLLRIEPA